MGETVVFAWLYLLDLTLYYLCSRTALLYNGDEPVEVLLARAALEDECLVQVPVVQVDLVQSHVERRTRLRNPLFLVLHADSLASGARHVHLNHKAQEEGASTLCLLIVVSFVRFMT